MTRKTIVEIHIAVGRWMYSFGVILACSYCMCKEVRKFKKIR
jgi:hypothetical protein